MLLKVWIGCNWHWLSAALLFSAGIFTCAFFTEYHHKWAYEGLTLALFCLAYSLMFTFLWRMSAGKMQVLERPHQLPRPSFIMMVVFSVGGCLLNLYHLVLKLALYTDNYKIVVNDHDHGNGNGNGNTNATLVIDLSDEELIWLNSIVRVFSAFLLPTTCYYIVQRAKVDSSRRVEQILANILNFIFAVLFIKSLCQECYILIEGHCNNKEMATKSLCPKFDQINSNQTTSLSEIGNEEMRAWLIVHSRVLRDVMVSIATELLPVFITCHLLSSGNAMQVERKATIVKSAPHIVNGKGVNSIWVEHAEINNKSVMPRLRRKWSLIILGLHSSLISIVTVHLTFFLSIKDWEKNDSAAFVFWSCNISLLLLSSIFAMAHYSLLLNWTQKVPVGLIDWHLKAASGADQCLMWGSLLFMFIQKISILAKFIMWIIPYWNENDEISLGEYTMRLAFMLREIIHLIARILSTCALATLASIPSDRLHEIGHFLPIVALCGTLSNATDFGRNYFRLDGIKNAFLQIDDPDSLLHFAFLLIQGFAGLGTYLYNMTSGLAWFDIVMRYAEIGFFNLSKKLQ